MELNSIIKDYYETRKLVWPNFDDAMKFVITEIGEAYEVDLVGKDYIRNNPENKPKPETEEFRKKMLGRELGDAMMMLQVAGMAEGCNPIQELLKKLGIKVDKVYVLSETP
jgi:hypothetical protein